MHVMRRGNGSRARSTPKKMGKTQIFRGSEEGQRMDMDAGKRGVLTTVRLVFLCMRNFYNAIMEFIVRRK